MSGRFVCAAGDELHGIVEWRRVRQRCGRPLFRNREHLRRRIPTRYDHMSRRCRPVRRGGVVYGIVRRLSGRHICAGDDELHGVVERRRVRQRCGRPLFRNREFMRGRFPAGGLHVPRAEWSMRCRGDVYGNVGRMSGGCLRPRDHDLHRVLECGCLRRRCRRPLRGIDERMRRRLPSRHVHVPAGCGSV